jgi:hypothetical protein
VAERPTVDNREVAQVVEPNVWRTNVIADPDEEARHVVGAEGEQEIDDGRKHEGVDGQSAASSLFPPRKDLLLVALLEGDADGIKSDGA